MYKVSLSPRAKKELNEAISWYDEQQDGLGKRLANEIEKKLTVISKQPDRYPVINNNIRQVRIEMFPYQILYFIKKQGKKLLFKASFTPNAILKINTGRSICYGLFNIINVLSFR